MKRQIIITLLTILLLLLWIPVTLDKLTDFQSFRAGILRQPFSDALGYTLLVLLPVLEIAVVIMLIRSKGRPGGFRLSSLLMAVFTAYNGVALLGAWEKLPCGCGSVIRGMSWQQHFWFNVFFLIHSLVGGYWHKNTSNPPSKQLAKKEQVAKNYIDISNSRPIGMFHTWCVIKLFRRRFAPFPGRPVDIYIMIRDGAPRKKCIPR